MPDVAALFDEYAAAFARGEEPDLREYLARAGEGADELARLVKAFVATSAGRGAVGGARRADPRVGREDQSPLLEMRTRRGVRRDQVVDAILGRFGIDSAKRQKVAGYYHELESGLLDPLRVDRSVWELLAELLRSSVNDLRRRPRLPAAVGRVRVAYRRAAPTAALEGLASPALLQPHESPSRPTRSTASSVPGLTVDNAASVRSVQG